MLACVQVCAAASLVVSFVAGVKVHEFTDILIFFFPELPVYGLPFSFNVTVNRFAHQTPNTHKSSGVHTSSFFTADRIRTRPWCPNKQTLSWINTRTYNYVVPLGVEVTLRVITAERIVVHKLLTWFFAWRACLLGVESMRAR